MCFHRLFVARGMARQAACAFGRPIGALLLLGATLPSWAAVFTVVHTNDSGAGSLRQAILDANANPGLDQIVFQIPGPGPYSIRPTSALDAVTDPVVIDGTTQPGFAGQPIIELNGAFAGAAVTGLRLLAGGSTVRGLVINRFSADAILIQTGGSNVIEGNFLGTDLTGTAPAGNTNAGIWINRSAGNRIGGTNAAARNLISGGNAQGIFISESASAGNVIQGNLIGTSLFGTNRLGNLNYGVYLLNAPSNLIGGPLPAARNVISGNGASGVLLLDPGTRGNRVQANIIGLDPAGTLVVSNRGDGISIDRASDNLIGGTNAAAQNVISGNGMAGVSIFGAGASGNRVQGNLIGTDASGRAARGNFHAGVTITGVASNLIGGTVPGARNVISGNRLDGIFLVTNSVGTRIEGNFIGVDVTGTNALANGYAGVSIDSAAGTLLGGTVPEARNIISGNGYHGVWITKPAASNNLVQGNYIGTDVTGRRAVRNVLAGVRIEDAPRNTVGGVGSGGNVLSGNGTYGVWIYGTNAVENAVLGNFVGTDFTGTNKLGNQNAGVGISDAPRNTIGGSAAGAGNVIAGNGDAGLFIVGPVASWNAVLGNLIGTDRTGLTALGNAYEGLYLQDGATNTIGGSAPGAGNVISGNLTWGVFLINSVRNVIQGNFIGVGRDGVTPLGNSAGSPGNKFHALELQSNANHNRVGGSAPGEGNRIAYAPGVYCGVRVRYGSFSNAILGNAIFANGALGIDLSHNAANSAGVSPNDPCDADTGANQVQNFPVLTNVVSGAQTRFRGTLNSAASRPHLIQFFASPACDPAGHGEGEVFLGETTVTTGPSCAADFSVMLPVSVPAGHVVTATATDAGGNTSEFSACASVTRLPELTFAAVDATHAVIAWSNTVSGCVLRETETLTEPIPWRAVTDVPILTGGVWTLPVVLTNGSRFYQLILP